MLDDSKRLSKSMMLSDRPPTPAHDSVPDPVEDEKTLDGGQGWWRLLHDAVNLSSVFGFVCTAPYGFRLPPSAIVMEPSHHAPLDCPCGFSKTSATASKTVWNYAVFDTACHTRTADLSARMKA